MDEVYIKMCDCPEIQEHKPTDESAFLHRWHGIDTDTINLSFENMIVEYNGDWTFPFDKRYIWLPRQEDIQEMLGKPKDKSLHFDHLQVQISGLYYFANPIEDSHDNWRDRQKYLSQFNNWDQLLIAYYMEKAHHKTWTEKGWV